MTTIDEFFSESLPAPDPLRDELIRMIKARDEATPRHLQKELGPSEVGHPCMRKLALGMMNEPRCNPQYDPLPSIVGTATHKWLESAASYANVPGANRFKMYTKEMSVVYRGQAHMYGRGYENAGLPVKQVAIALLPRGGTLSGMHLWREDYNPQLVNQILRRREAVMVMLNDFRVEIDPGRYEWFPKTPYDCMFCSWFKPDPRSPIQCNGKVDA
jgi:hypothetical protein